MYGNLPPNLIDCMISRKKYKNMYKRLRANDVVFVFKYDDVDPSILHIFSRHLATPEDAIDTFFSGTPAWNAERQRFETTSETHGLYWFWLEENKTVMVISCFRI